MRFEAIERGKVWRECAAPSPKCYWIVKLERDVFTVHYGTSQENSVVLHNRKRQTFHSSFIAACQVATDHAKACGRPQYPERKRRPQHGKCYRA